ncbi:hypothetical protein D9M72_587620 [compost metagenome]
MPGDDGGFVNRSGPFEIADGDLAQLPACDRIEEIAVPERLHVTGALDARLVQIHRAGHVDGQDQFDIDIRRRGGRWARATTQ